MKKIIFLLFCSLSIVYFFSGCKLWDELNTPVRKSSKQQKTTPQETTYKPQVLPDGTTVGLNEYEMQYMKDIDKSFEVRQKENARKVFGGLSR
jgi:hypothetical protein